LLIPLPVIAAFLKEKPESMGLLPDGAAWSHASTPVAANEIGLTLREAVHTSSILDHGVRAFSGDRQRACLFYSFARNLGRPREHGSPGSFR
jgi:hypothetical protein